MVEMGEMAQIGDRMIWIYYMLGLSSMPNLTAEASTLRSAAPRKRSEKIAKST